MLSGILVALIAVTVTSAPAFSQSRTLPPPVDPKSYKPPPPPGPTMSQDRHYPRASCGMNPCSPLPIDAPAADLPRQLPRPIERR